MTTKQKGDLLEDAVHAIESMIFKTEPGFKEATIIFERNKIINDKGVHHEIDLIAEIQLGMLYTSLFIFECKNWKNKVDKNEIMVFSEKIDVIKAQKGFFIAKEFTEDAKNRAKNDGRIELVYATDDITIESFPLKTYSSKFTVTRMIVKGEIEHRSYSYDEIFLLDNIPTSLESIRNDLLRDFDTQLSTDEPEVLLMQNTFEREAIYPFEAGRLSFEEKQIEGIKLFIKVEVTEIRPVVKSQFNILTRGRHSSVEYDNPESGITMTTDFTSLARGEEK